MISHKFDFWLSELQIYGSWGQVWSTKGEEQEVAKEEFTDCFKVSEGALGDNPCLGARNSGSSPSPVGSYTYES